MANRRAGANQPVVLVVGDGPWRMNVTEALEDHTAIRTLSVAGANAAHEHLATEQVDCIITDHPLSDTDTSSFLADLQEHHSSIPTVTYTDSGSERVASEVTTTGDAYIDHDDHDRLDRLIETVEQGLARRQERIALERDLRQSEELHRVTLNNMTDTVLITNEDGVFTYICPNIHFIFGYSVEEVRELGTIDVLLGNDLFTPTDLDSQGVLTNIECTATDRAGEEHILLVNVRQVAIQGGTTLYSCRDITARKRREKALTVLHNTARELLYAETDREIAHQVATDATEILNAATACYLFDADANLLRPVADTVSDPLKPVQPGDNSLGEQFLHGEIASLEEPFPGGPITDFRDGLCIPLGDHGVLFAGTNEDVFDELTLEVADLIAATTEAALDRVEREQALHERDRVLRNRTRQLARLNRINDIIREIDRVIVSADTREEIEHAVCERLTSTDRFPFAWIGEPAPNGIVPRTWAGDDRGYLDATREMDTEPAVQTVDSNERTHISNVAINPRKAPWRTEALARGYQSVLSVPLSAGALTVYATEPEAIDETLRSVLEELGETVTAAIDAVGRKDALLGDSITVLEYETTDPACTLYRLARSASCSLELRGGVQRIDDTLLGIILTENARMVFNAAENTTGANPGRTIDTDTGLLELELPESFIATPLADRGAALRTMSATPDSARFTVEVPTSMDTRVIDALIMEEYSETTLLSQREEHRSLMAGEHLRSDVLERLTDRQLEITRLAYHAGFFESPRTVTGEDLATMLSISPAAFYQHIRRTQRKLFAVLFDGVSSMQLNNEA